MLALAPNELKGSQGSIETVCVSSAGAAQHADARWALVLLARTELPHLLLRSYSLILLHMYTSIIKPLGALHCRRVQQQEALDVQAYLHDRC